MASSTLSRFAWRFIAMPVSMFPGRGGWISMACDCWPSSASTATMMACPFRLKA